MTNTQSNELVTADEVAQHFRVAVALVRRWARTGRVPCVRASRRVVRFRLAEVERALTRKGADHE